MTSAEFEKVWNLLSSLYPNSAAKKSKVDIAVWWRALKDYDMKKVSETIMAYAKKNKYFPDLVDITKHLLGGYADAETAIINNARLYAKLIGVKPPKFKTKEDAMNWYYEMKGDNDES